MTYDLTDIVFSSISSQTNQAVIHYDLTQFENATAIINEWTTISGECVLTHNLNDTMETIEDELLYVSFDETDSVTYGTFNFVSETELPIDNN